MTLREAHDINDDGWIIAWGNCTFVDVNLNGRYAVLLTPFGTCAQDITRDGLLNVLDLLAVINGWGECAIGQFCNADVTGNFLVNVDDLLAVMNNWGACATPEDAPQSVQDCQNRCANYFGTSGAEYTDCVSKCIQALCETGRLPASECN